MFSKLPWTNKDSNDSSQPSSDSDESLTTILSTSNERSQLTLLIATCAESMRHRITDTFTDTEPLDTAHQPDNDDALHNPDTDISEDGVNALDAVKEHERRAAELYEPKTMELKEAALADFDAWRDKVFQRVGEAVDLQEEVKEQKEVKRVDTKGESHTQSRLSSQTVAGGKPWVPMEMDVGVNETMVKLYPQTPTPLSELPEEKRALVLHSILLLLLSLEHYVSYSRILLLRLTTSLKLDMDLLAEDEGKTARALLTAALQEMNADGEMKKKKEENKETRHWKVGLASVAGAALIGVTGGLAAPLLAAGIGTVMGGLGLGATAAAGYLGALAGSSVLVGGLFGAYGGRMTGQMMDEYAKEVEDFGFLPIWQSNKTADTGKTADTEKDNRRLRVAIGISGWLTDQDEIIEPWRVLSPSIEGFALRWELEPLLKLGNSMSIMVKSYAWSYARREIIKRTVFATLYAGLWPLNLLKVSRVIDNPFSIAKARSEKAGEVLADALVNHAQGERPVTLIGYSLGARVIFKCLIALAERKAFGLVESVVLLGAPTPSDSADWRKMRAVVAGRLINVYSDNDYTLAFLYRSSSIQFGIAGLQAIQGVKGVENVDVSEMVSGHTAYRYLTGKILQRVGFEDISVAETEREEKELQEVRAREEAERQEKEKQSKPVDEIAEEEARDIERKAEQKSQETLMSRATENLSLNENGEGVRRGTK
ncbi:DUF726-domain-containing protein [Eremomyces bilateralis CBS 781.70]|uniref:DUF726-domain-containing protein n=1 Tax=Eremomyces bilateralis CBS 781.70 TaxID=1392243 RepID=A0A6G1G089_9PEZI|nr:DUF726-domain-containing protein [Eremomyces bilateralis CBS 781.70]KAF1811392.1 DUF726-domain-containing protein [Eremomyces bilateralis CBS 781.70]